MKNKYKKNISILVLIVISFLAYSSSNKYHSDAMIFTGYDNENGKYNLSLSFFEKKDMKEKNIVILKGVSFFEVKSNATIYYISESDSIVKKNKSQALALGITFKQLPKLPKYVSTSAPPHFTVDEKNKKVFFASHAPDGRFISSFNLISKKQKIFTSKKYGYIVFFSLSPDRKKLAFYNSSKYYPIIVDILFLENGKIKNVAPPSCVIYPSAPFRIPPAWNNNSNTIFFMAEYTKEKQKIASDVGVYSSSINTTTVQLIANGHWPYSFPDSNELFYSAYSSAEGIPAAKMINLKNNQRSTLLSQACYVTLSCSKRYIAYGNPSDKSFMLYDLKNGNKIVLSQPFHAPPEYWWVILKSPNNIKY